MTCENITDGDKKLFGYVRILEGELKVSEYKLYKGDTLMDKTESFVKEYLGITQDEVDTIRNMMWEEVE